MAKPEKLEIRWETRPESSWAIMVNVGSTLGHLGVILVLFSAILADLEAILDHLGPILAHLGAILEPSRGHLVAMVLCRPRAILGSS